MDKYERVWRSLKKIGIIGYGFVGKRLADKLSKKCKVIIYDKKNSEDYPFQELELCDFVMICVDTPSNNDGSVNIKNVEEAIKTVPNTKILLRSTVPPGTTDYLCDKYHKNICFAPEYVGESVFIASSWEDFEKRGSFFILGGEERNCSLFRDDIEYIYGPYTTIMQMKASEAELVKYMENSYFALKISFVNEFRNLAEFLGLNWNSVREGWLVDARIERDHTSAFKESPGYAGKCLPKDVSGIIKFAENKKYHMEIMEAVQKFNDSLLKHRR